MVRKGSITKKRTSYEEAHEKSIVKSRFAHLPKEPPDKRIGARVAALITDDQISWLRRFRESRHQSRSLSVHFPAHISEEGEGCGVAYNRR